MNYIIYKITNIKTNQIYIGKTTQTLEARWADHLSEAKRWANCKQNKLKFGYNSKLYPAMNKYGFDSFIISLITTADSIEELNLKEKEWIEKLNTRKNGYNISAGGDGGFFLGCHHSAEAKEKIGVASRSRKLPPEARQKISDKKLGKKHSQQTIQKIRQNRAGKTTGKRTVESRQKMAISHSIPIICVETGIIYNSTKEAAKLTGILRSAIANCICGKSKTAGGFHWKKLIK